MCSVITVLAAASMPPRTSVRWGIMGALCRFPLTLAVELAHVMQARTVQLGPTHPARTACLVHRNTIATYRCASRKQCVIDFINYSPKSKPTDTPTDTPTHTHIS